MTRFSLGNGFEPSSLTLGADGSFYGTTQFGGNLSGCDGYGCGTIFRLTPDGMLTTLYSFSGADGVAPNRLVQGTDGNFYGTTFCSSIGGGERQPLPHGKLRRSIFPDGVFLCDGPGAVFRISPSGSLALLHRFNGADGSAPLGGLVQGQDGNFYGTAAAGGSNNDGTVFKVTPSGELTTLHNFAGTDGQAPYDALVQASDGSFYGSTEGGGAGGQGVIFRITSSGTETTVHSFTGGDGATPNGSLVLGSDGNFYGTTNLGGANHNCFPNNDCGTIFKMTPDGALTTLYNFSGADGANPNSGLVRAADENFYGTTAWGGETGAGVVFRITAGALLSTLHSLCTQIECQDGEVPVGPLVQGATGLLYGAARLGGGVNACNGGAGCGIVFATGPSSSASQFVPVTPCRLLDTRWFGPIQGGTIADFSVPILAELTGCTDVSSATAFSLNVTVIPHEPLGYLTTWAASQNQPNVSTLNSVDGRTKANAVIVPSSYWSWAPGELAFYVSNTTDVVLDIDGYFTDPGEHTLQFYPLGPCRALDTRNGGDGGTLRAGQERDYSMPGRCGIPADAEAYSLNITAIPAPGGLDYLTVWAQGEPRPGVSTLNAPTGTVVANAAIVAAGGNRTVAFYPNGNNTDLLVDVNGYFAPPGPGGNSFYYIPPCRIYDSRDNHGRPFSGEKPVNIAANPCAPPSNAAGYLLNATVVPSGSLGYLALWADGEQQPVASTLNALDGFITSNMTIVPTTDGKIDAYAAGTTHLILDIAGYFAP